MVDDFGRAIAVLHDPRRRFPCLLHIRFVAREPPQAGLGVSDCRGDGLL